MGCNCHHVAAYTFKRQHNNHLPQIRDHLGMVAHPNAEESTVRGSICLASPDLGQFWGGAYMYWSIFETLPLTKHPLGIDDIYRVITLCSLW